MLIYLDSQDYSRLSDPKTANELANSDLRSLLVHVTSAGYAVVPFSNLHIQEAVHDNIGSRDLAARRADLMAALAGRSVYAPLEHVLRKEVAEAVARMGEPLPAGLSLRIVRTDGIWWPWEVLADEGPLDLGSEIAKLMGAADGSNRASRRQRGPNKGQLKALVNASLPEAMTWAAENFPGSERLGDRKFFSDFLLGKMDESRFYSEMMKSALNLQRFVSWTVDKLDGGKQVSGYIKTSGYALTEKIAEALKRMFESASECASPEVAPALAKIRDEGIERATQSMRRGMIDAGLRMLRKEVGSAGSGRFKYSAENVDSHTAGVTPGIDMVCACFKVWLTLVSAPSPTRQKVLRSDALDILHSIYLPYVDLFRADDRFRNVLRQTKTGHFSKVVSAQDLSARLRAGKR
jgi:hypothetical protein